MKYYNRRFYKNLLVAVIIVVCFSCNQLISSPTRRVTISDHNYPTQYVNHHYDGEIKEVIDTKRRIYKEFFTNGKCRRIGSFDLKTLEIRIDSATNRCQIIKMTPVGKWKYYDSYGILRRICKLKPNIIVTVDSCDIGDGFFEKFYVSDFEVDSCELINN